MVRLLVTAVILASVQKAKTAWDWKRTNAKYTNANTAANFSRIGISIFSVWIQDLSFDGLMAFRAGASCRVFTK